MVIVIALAVLVGLLAIAAAVIWTAPARRPASGESVREVVDLVLELASDKLGDTVSAGTRELDVRSHAFTSQVADVKSELQRLDRLVSDLNATSSAQHGTLVENLRQVATTNASLAAHTDALRQALASPKQRGQWGERMADDVLAAAGMVDGVNFRRQTAIDGGTIPDFSFLLPHDLELRMDVKFPIDNYLRVLEADADADRSRHTKAFVNDVRGRIKELAGRGYVDARDTVDCMLLFIPNEAVYGFLHESDPDVLDVALGHKVVLCSPSTLFAVLAVVRQSVEQFRLERTSDEILRCLGGVTDEWAKFTTTIDKVVRQLDTLNRSVNDELDGTRRRVFEQRLGEIDRLRDAQAPLPAGSGSGEALAARRAAGDVRELPLRPSERDEAV